MAHISKKELLERGVDTILPGKDGLSRLMAKRPVRVYLGVDPTSPMLHIGHAIPLRKLRQLQDLGHEVILLFGTFTARIGDPTDREQERQPLTDKEIRENMRTYKKQASKILDMHNIEIQENHSWLSKLKFDEILKLSSHVTVSQLLERDMFQVRLQKGKQIWMHEFLYPLMQGYDSVALNVDLEIGATDQTFNMLVGRKLQEVYNSKEKFVLTVPMLLGLDGRKMSKSFGNTINILDEPNDMFGKVMSVRDELIWHYFELATDLSDREINSLKRQGLHIRDLKARLAKEIVTIYHDKVAAEKAEKEFDRVFKQKDLPSDMPTVKISGKKISLIDMLVQCKLASSKSEARRLIQQGGVRIDDSPQKEDRIVSLKKDSVVRVGKRRFVKIE